MRKRGKALETTDAKGPVVQKGGPASTFGKAKCQYVISHWVEGFFVYACTIINYDTGF